MTLNREDYRTAIPSLEKKIKTSFDSANESLDKLKEDIEEQFGDLDDRLDDIEDEISNLISVQSPITYSGGVIGIDIGDYIVEQGTENGWTYRIWKSGKREAWKTQTVENIKLNTSNGGWYCDSDYGQTVTDFPTDLFTSMPLEFASAVCDGSSTNVDTCIMGANRSLTNFGNVLLHRGGSYGTSRTYIIYMYAIQL